MPDDDLAETIELLPGYAIPRYLRIERRRASWWDSGDFWVEGDAEYVGDQYVVTRFEIEACDPYQHGVTSDDLRRLAPTDMLRTALEEAVGRDGNARGFAWGVMTPEDRDRMREAGPVTETLAAVGKLYVVARALREPVNPTIQRLFQVSRPTADRWVAKARERGFLEHSDRSTGGTSV